MSGLEVVGAVAAVVSAFHGGAELVAHIKKKHRRRSSRNQTQQDFEEKQLQDSLETGETQVTERFTSDVKELGEIVRVGDAIARDRLLHIAIVMQAEIIKSLQIAVKYDNAILNLKILHEASIMNRKDSIVTLDELKQRILITSPVPRTMGVPEGHTASFESAQTFRPANLTLVPNNYIPSAVTIPAPEEVTDTKTGLAKYFSMKRSNSQASTTSPQRPASSAGGLTFSPALNHLIQGSDNRATIMKDIDDIISSYQSLYTDDRRDTWAILNGGSYNSQRDTLAIHNREDYTKRNTRGLNQDAIQMLSNLTPTPEELHENTEYPAFNHNVFQHQLYGQQSMAAPKPLSQRPPVDESRWSAGSSVYSDTVPPSLYSQDSRSSNESPIPIVPDHSLRTPSTTRLPPLNTFQGPQTPPEFSYHSPQSTKVPPLVPLAGPSRTHVSSAAPFAGPQRTRTPPIAPFLFHRRSSTPTKNDHGALKTGKTRVLLVPNQDHSSTFSTARSAISMPKLESSSAPVAASPVSPPPPPVPPKGDLIHSRSNSSSNPSIRTGTIQGPISSHEPMMSGRPCKDNNYWGFCKGAWAVREDLKRGLALQTRPDGMYNTHQVWQCKHCHFQGETFNLPHPTKKGKKEAAVNPNVYTSAVGIRYRWIFLAKSHVKKKTMAGGSNLHRRKNSVNDEKDDTNYGCILCAVEGNVTGIYGNVETLMNHIFLEHATSMSEKTAMKSKCVLGRVAAANEDWDLNVPMKHVFSA